MTTIAWDGKTIASDSQETTGDTITNFYAMKIFEVDSLMLGKYSVYQEEVYVYGLAGDSGAHLVIAEKLRENINHQTVFPSEMRVSGIFVVGLHRAFVLIKEQGETTANIYVAGSNEVIGSGRDIARTAMVLGYDAVEAIKTAIKLDVYTGGDIQRYTIK